MKDGKGRGKLGRGNEGRQGRNRGMSGGTERNCHGSPEGKDCMKEGRMGG